MSLDWNTKNCPGNGLTSGWIDRVEGEVGFDADPRYIHPDTNSLVWGAFCGFFINEITVQNIDEVVWRIAFLKKVGKPWMSDAEFPTPEAVDAHLGFHTNCDTKTRKQWLAFVTKCLSDDVTRDIAA